MIAVEQSSDGVGLAALLALLLFFLVQTICAAVAYWRAHKTWRQQRRALRDLQEGRS